MLTAYSYVCPCTPVVQVVAGLVRVLSALKTQQEEEAAAGSGSDEDEDAEGGEDVEDADDDDVSL